MFRAWTRRWGLVVLGHECLTRRFRTERRARWRRRGGEETLVLRQSLVGVAPAVGEIWPSAYSSIWSTIKMMIMFGRWAGVQEGEWCKRIGSGWSELTRIAEVCRRQWRRGVQESEHLAALGLGGKEGKQRGGVGLLIGAAVWRIEQWIDGIEGGE
jgi:hypothetical protein